MNGNGGGRGRARGRARATGKMQPAPRPGMPGGNAQDLPVLPPSGTQLMPHSAAGNGESYAAVGRAKHRGSTRPEPRPGTGPSPRPTMAGGDRQGGAPSQQMARLTLGKEPPQQPDRSNHGALTQVFANMFRVSMPGQAVLYQYHVDFSPDIESRRLRRGLLASQEELIGGTWLFDGSVLFLPRPLPKEVTEVAVVTKRDQEHVKLTIKFTNELPATSPTFIHLINILMKRCLEQMGLMAVGRNYYSQEQRVSIPEHRLEVWPGFVSSIFAGENGHLLLSLDVSHKVMHTDTVWDKMLHLQRRVHSEEQWWAACRAELVGQGVITRYNNRTYRVDDIDFQTTPTSTFQLRDGQNISFIEYYQKKLGKEIQEGNQPLLVCTPKGWDKKTRPAGDRTLLLVPELATLTGLTDQMRKDFRVMRQLAQHTRADPEPRMGELTGFLKHMNQTSGVMKELGGWGVSFQETPVQIPAMVLKPEMLEQEKGKKYSYDIEEADWMKTMRGLKLAGPATLDVWLIVFPKRNAREAQDLLQSLHTVCGPMGVGLSQPERIAIDDDRTNTYVSTLRRTIQPRHKLVMAILPGDRLDRYSAIKKVCSLERAVPSQVVLVKTLSKKNMLLSVATKIALQLNCKLGGQLWTLKIPIGKPFMVVGIDTYHDTVKRGRSVCGFVASTNSAATSYYSRVVFQQPKEELASRIGVLTTDALKNFHQVTQGKLPENIFVYRDGVGDGMLEAVMEKEVQEMRNAISKLAGEECKMKLTYIIVKKRINTRLYVRNSRKRGKLDNPLPGTVVETDITRPEWTDFFLVSQSVRQGTVSPTHYNIILNESDFQPHHFQMLTYKLCHLYYNWPGTIQVPAPCQYAHKLAYLVGTSLHGEPDRELSNKLHFL